MKFTYYLMLKGTFKLRNILNLYLRESPPLSDVFQRVMTHKPRDCRCVYHSSPEPRPSCQEHSIDQNSLNQKIDFCLPGAQLAAHVPGNQTRLPVAFPLGASPRIRRMIMGQLVNYFPHNLFPRVHLQLHPSGRSYSSLCASLLSSAVSLFMVFPLCSLFIPCASFKDHLTLLLPSWI